MLPSCQCCQGPGGSSELGEWKVEAHGNFAHPTFRDTRFCTVSKPEPGISSCPKSQERLWSELDWAAFFPWGVNGICMEPKSTQTNLHIFAHVWQTLRIFAEAQEPEALNAPVAEPFPTATDHAEQSAASARGVQGGGQGSASCVSHEAKEPGPQLRYASVQYVHYIYFIPCEVTIGTSRAS